MREPVTKYTLREISRNGTVYPQIVFTLTVPEIAALSGKIQQIRPAIILASTDATDIMTVRGLNKSAAEESGFKAEKDLMLVYRLFARRAMKHDHTVTVSVWSGAPGDHEDAVEDDDFVRQASYSPPDELFTYTPGYFRKNYRLPLPGAAQKFYEIILAKTKLNEKTPLTRNTLKITSSRTTRASVYG